MNKITKNKLYNYNQLKNDLNNLKDYYNSFYIGSIGKSILGDEIKYLKIGDGNNKIFINAAHNANDCITTLIIMNFIEKYLELKKQRKMYKGYNIRELWQKNSLYIVPMVNPDGVNLYLKDENILNNKKYKYIWEKYKSSLNNWEANIRGVDLKLNYPNNFEKIKRKKYINGIIKPGPKDYIGPNFLSESETISIYEFIKINKFNLIISLQLGEKEIICNNNKLGKRFEKISRYKLINLEEESNFFDCIIKINRLDNYEILFEKKIKEIYYKIEEIILTSLES